MLSILPIEVIEVVIDHVDYYPSTYETGITLRNLALTCRQLLPRARLRLFSSISIGSRRQYWTLCDVLERNPSLLPLVGTVTIRTVASGTEEPEDARSVRKFLSLHEIVPVMLLSQLPNLRRWRQHSELSPFNPPYEVARCLTFSSSTLALLKQCTARSSLRFLHLTSLCFRSFLDLARYISAFPRIQELAIDCVRAAPFGRYSGTGEEVEEGLEDAFKDLPQLAMLDVSTSEH